jgi:repressor LexA
MLTARQEDIYRFIRDYVACCGHGPLLTDIAKGIGIHSKGTVHRYVGKLARAGLIELVPGRHRGIRLRDQDRDAPGRGLTLPLLGKIAAGHPMEAIPGSEEIDLAGLFIAPGRFVLKIQGDSMIEAGILDGDMVIVEQREWADNDALVVALIDHQDATLKRLRHNSDGTVTLFPANRALAPVTYPAERVCIQGIVVGQLRAYR